MPDRVDTRARLHAHVEMLAATIGERHVWEFDALSAAAAYVEHALASYGYRPSRCEYDLRGREVANIEAVLEGSAEPGDIVIAGAHYDSVLGCPGANDNATGVAAVLELARRLAPQRRRKTIRFVAFVNEEPPFFQTPEMGAVVYATRARERGERISAMLSLETLGYYSTEPGSQQYPAPLAGLYPDTGDFIAFVSNLRSAGLLRRARRAFRARTSFPLQAGAAPAIVPGIGWSDHWAFWQAGYHAMMVTDTAPFRYPWYHTVRDTIDWISFDQLSAVVDGLEYVFHVLAGGV